ncbi:MAG: FAD-dependent oxidoreductase [Gammaproteobacteria bacterium]|nr:FAD-dependent oxidoreductase [Gammaproteobacteria bacterium]
MSTDPRYQSLFEPVQIGPVTAKNRFYQVPHCTGLGWLRPQMVAALRGTKAEGGWGVVCTEYCSIHPSSDDLPYPYHSLWDEGDIKAHALMTGKVHEHGALAGVELWAGGARSTNLFSREVPLSVSSMPNLAGNPRQTRQMDKSDIRRLRQWHRKAALRAKEAEFDIVYVYATHGYLLSSFLSSTTNCRTDEYGGSVENRGRLLRELIEETKEAVGDRCAVAVRFSADDGGGRDGVPVYHELRETFENLAELPDLWDINIGDYSYEMGVSRFVKEGSLEPYMSFVKSVTTKPVVTVGRFTSPDTMVSQVRRGIVDFIGAARPSIADPFLPNKIKHNQLEDIRECIGCNVCYASDGLGVPIRCTQNPTMGEEWRRDWHPEKIPPMKADLNKLGSTVLIVGAGPTGLEAACAAGRRGYNVLLAESTRELGGRVAHECKLPGLSEWARVRDYRVQRLSQMPNVEIFMESEMSVNDIMEVDADHVLIATGSHWRRDGFGRDTESVISNLGSEANLFTPDDIMSDKFPTGSTMVYDDDSYYMGSVIAEKLAILGLTVSYVTPEAKVSTWSVYTAEQPRVHKRLMDLGVNIITSRSLSAFDGHEAQLKCGYGGEMLFLECESVVLVTAKTPNDQLYYELQTHLEPMPSKTLRSISKVGDSDSPSIIAEAIFAGHRWARELDEDIDLDNPAKYDRVFASLS